MKKYFIFLCMLVFAVFLTSCGKKTEIKPYAVKGEEMGKDEINELVDKYNDYYENLEDEDKLYDQWYSVDYEMLYNSDDEEDYGYEYIKVDGKLYESSYTFESKFKLTIKLEYENEDKETGIVTTASGTIKITYIDANCYAKIDMKSTTKGEYEKETITIKEKITCDVDEIDDIVGTISESDSTRFGSISEFMQLAKSSINSEKAKVYKSNNTYTYDTNDENDNSSSKSMAIIKINDEFDLKEFKVYSSRTYQKDNVSSASYMKAETKKSLGSLIVKPFGSEDYLEGSLDDIMDNWF